MAATSGAGCAVTGGRWVGTALLVLAGVVVAIWTRSILVAVAVGVLVVFWVGFYLSAHRHSN
jgi:hypothetical protein